MEYCEKGELLNYVVKKRKLDEDEASYFYFQLINGLENIHHHGICHRDLKFGNLLINSSDILKIIDFGLSNYYDNINLLSSRCGSSLYASPELISNKKYNGFTSDIWSSGIILYGMLCGYLPFDGKNPKVLYENITKGKLIFPHDLSNDAMDIIRKLLDTNPNTRITIPKIKKHPFYLKGKTNFVKLHQDLLEKVERKYDEQIDERARQFIAKVITYQNQEEDKKENKDITQKKDGGTKEINLSNNNKETEKFFDKQKENRNINQEDKENKISKFHYTIEKMTLQINCNKDKFIKDNMSNNNKNIFIENPQSHKKKVSPKTEHSKKNKNIIERTEGVPMGTEYILKQKPKIKKNMKKVNKLKVNPKLLIKCDITPIFTENSRESNRLQNYLNKNKLVNLKYKSIFDNNEEEEEEKKKKNKKRIISLPKANENRRAKWSSDNIDLRAFPSNVEEIKTYHHNTNIFLNNKTDFNNYINKRKYISSQKIKEEFNECRNAQTNNIKVNVMNNNIKNYIVPKENFELNYHELNKSKEDFYPKNYIISDLPLKNNSKDKIKYSLIDSRNENNLIIDKNKKNHIIGLKNKNLTNDESNNKIFIYYENDGGNHINDRNYKKNIIFRNSKIPINDSNNKIFISDRNNNKNHINDRNYKKNMILRSSKIPINDSNNKIFINDTNNKIIINDSNNKIFINDRNKKNFFNDRNYKKNFINDSNNKIFINDTNNKILINDSNNKILINDSSSENLINERSCKKNIINDRSNKKNLLFEKNKKNIIINKKIYNLIKKNKKPKKLNLKRQNHNSREEKNLNADIEYRKKYIFTGDLSNYSKNMNYQTINTNFSKRNRSQQTKRKIEENRIDSNKDFLKDKIFYSKLTNPTKNISDISQYSKKNLSSNLYRMNQYEKSNIELLYNNTVTQNLKNNCFKYNFKLHNKLTS